MSWVKKSDIENYLQSELHWGSDEVAAVLKDLQMEDAPSYAGVSADSFFNAMGTDQREYHFKRMSERGLYHMGNDIPPRSLEWVGAAANSARDEAGGEAPLNEDNVVEEQINEADDALDQSQEYWDKMGAIADEMMETARSRESQWQEHYGPDSAIGSQLINESIITPEAISRARDSATADVSRGIQQQEDAQDRRMQGFGIDPSSPAAMAGARGQNVREAAMKASAWTGAGNAERDRRNQLAAGLASGNMALAGMAQQGQQTAAGVNQGAGAGYGQTGMGYQQMANPWIAGNFGIEGANIAADASRYGANQARRSAQETNGPWWMPNLGFNFARGGQVPGYAEGGPVEDPARFGIEGATPMVTGPDGVASPTDPAAFGHITGPGTETSDDVNAFVSKNEYIVPAFATIYIGTKQLDAMVEEARQGDPTTPRRVAGDEPEIPGETIDMERAEDGSYGIANAAAGGAFGIPDAEESYARTLEMMPGQGDEQEGGRPSVGIPLRGAPASAPAASAPAAESGAGTAAAGPGLGVAAAFLAGALMMRNNPEAVNRFGGGATDAMERSGVGPALTSAGKGIKGILGAPTGGEVVEPPPKPSMMDALSAYLERARARLGRGADAMADMLPDLSSVSLGERVGQKMKGHATGGHAGEGFGVDAAFGGKVKGMAVIGKKHKNRPASVMVDVSGKPKDAKTQSEMEMLNTLREAGVEDSPFGPFAGAYGTVANPYGFKKWSPSTGSYGSNGTY